MAHAFAIWFARVFPSVRVAVMAPQRLEQPLRIEVERLPDYLWRDLGFQRPSRPGDGVRRAE